MVVGNNQAGWILYELDRGWNRVHRVRLGPQARWVSLHSERRKTEQKTLAPKDLSDRFCGWFRG